ncbi:MAG: carboxypeptidase regulatory-like domain-containing protein [Acidobacteriota bacterium]|nr:carboxypeptidase regulatory-like domain-containing protein [Acidobacteriota bacterium]
MFFRRLFVCALFVLAASLSAQDFRATVAGHVVDASGGSVAGVTVQVLNLETNESAVAVTTSSGTYTVPFLKPGTYRISVEAAGFKKFIRDNVVLNVGQVAGIDIALEVGAMSDVVTVTAESAVLETENADRGLVIDSKQVSELPLNARNPFMLSILSAGVNFNGNPIYQRPFDNGAIADWSINGGLDRKNEFLLDGAPNNAQAGGNNLAYVPPVDSVAEFKIQTNSYDAQYGKTAGGVVNVSLKSGTNALHGTLYEFLRRNGLDANSFQNNARGVDKSGHFLDQYGGAIGGPVVIPRIYNGKDKSFFFFNYEGYREGTPTPLNLSVPQPEFLSGDFSKLVDSQGRKITIYDPNTGRVDASGNFVRDAFPGNIIPSNRLNPISQKILGYFPKPNISTPGFDYGQNDFFVAGGQNLDADSFYNLVIKFDQNIGSNNHLFFRHASNDRTEERSFNGLSQSQPGGDGQFPLKRINDAYVLDLVSTLSPTLIFNARFSVSRYVEGSRGDGNAGFNLTSLGFPTSLVSQLPVPGFFGRYEFSSYQSLGRFYSFNYTNTIAFHPTITKIAGKHDIKAGVDIRSIQYNDQNVGNPFRLTADRGFTQKVYNNGDSLSGNSIASFLLGDLSGGNVDYNIFPSYRYPYYAPYVQDDYKASRRLTLNLGLRWDFNFSPTERYNRLNRSFDPTVTNPVNASIDRAAFPDFPVVRGGLLFAQKGQRPGNNDYTGIQPRIGFAYQVNLKTVVRGGFGRYIINPNNDYFRNSGYSLSTGVVNSLDGGRTPIPNTVTTPFPLGVQIPPGSSLGAGTFVGRGFDFFDPTFKLPYSNQFSFAIQRELPLRSQFEISYVGNRGYKLQTDRAYNEPSLEFRKQCNIYEGGSPLFCDQRIPNPFYNLPQFAGTGLGTSPTYSRFDAARPFPEFGGLTQRGRNDGKLWYNGLQTTLNVRGSHGLNLTFAYTFSKAVEQGGFTSDGNTANSAFLDTQRFIPERSLTTYDRTHVVKVSTVYELPFGKGKRFGNFQNGFASRLVSGWEHTMIFQFSSGRPWDLPGGVRILDDARLAPDFNSAVVRAVRPCVGKVNDDGTTTLQPFSASYPGCSLSTLDFLINPRYAPRETPFRDGRIRLDSRPQFDMSLSKMTHITEKVSIQFRAEAFNVFNKFWIPLQNFDNDPNSANFGTIIRGTVGQGNANFPRQIQLAFKMIY